MHVHPQAQQLLAHFIDKSKFDESDNEESTGLSFQGLANPVLKSPLTNLINQSAKDFAQTALHQPTEEKFRQDIKMGLQRFNPYYLELDTEDRECICTYFEELMDCVGLESSDGLLNEWMYGFDPNEKSVKD